MATVITNRTYANLASTDHVDILPEVIPATQEDVFVGDVWLESIHIVNTTASAVTVTVKDKQATPTIVLPAISVPANSDVLREFKGRLCPGGMTWVASVANALHGYASGRRQL